MSPDAARRRQTVPTQLAAMAAGVQESTIRKWASRGKLVRYGSPGRAEYDLAELMAIVTGDAAEDAGVGDTGVGDTVVGDTVAGEER